MPGSWAAPQQIVECNDLTPYFDLGVVVHNYLPSDLKVFHKREGGVEWETGMKEIKT